MILQRTVEDIKRRVLEYDPTWELIGDRRLRNSEGQEIKAATLLSAWCAVLTLYGDETCYT